ncbi:hypothetical protein PIB30_016842 [Stylosanthes scabra]|uniref:Uncharacterized protein n=1 Tax=Stylosanthes scabra TaxID=79078 RepID=A0ABU6T759_9FABA|nr:hypothetical protein [Stylosanthes scabra]
MLSLDNHLTFDDEHMDIGGSLLTEVVEHEGNLGGSTISRDHRPKGSSQEEDERTTPPPPVMPTSSLSEGLPMMRMIPIPGLRGEEENIAANEAAATAVSRVYLIWDGGRLQEIAADQHEELSLRDLDQYTQVDPPPSLPLEKGWLLRWDEQPHSVRCLRGLIPTFGILCKAIIDVGGPESPPINEEAIWLRIAGGRKKRGIYGKGVIPVYSVPLIIGDIDDDNTASGPPNVREHVTLLNRELSKQAEANREKVAQVEADFDEKMQSDDFGSAAFTAMHSPPSAPLPPPARSPSPQPQPDRATSSSHHHDDNPDYV